MIIFDSCVWIAFLNKADSQHTKAAKVLAENNDKIVMTEYILLEVASVLCLRAGKSRADKFLKIVMNNKDIKIITSDKTFLLGTINEFLRYKTKYLSFVDFSLVYLSKQYKIITFDEKLKQFLLKQYENV
ncbi:MAG: PIN domain-containing protein [Nitrospiraceae bacterium]|nr:PIN domain-containing protein [Nitrospiraceae bacterium]